MGLWLTERIDPDTLHKYRAVPEADITMIRDKLLEYESALKKAELDQLTLNCSLRLAEAAAVREAGDKWLRATTEQIDRMQKVYYKALSAFHKEQGKRQARAVFPLEPRSRASSSP